MKPKASLAKPGAEGEIVAEISLSSAYRTRGARRSVLQGHMYIDSGRLLKKFLVTARQGKIGSQRLRICVFSLV